MKLVFEKDSDNVNVSICDKETISDFDYIKMINILYNEKIIEPSIFGEGFSEDEITNINAFVSEISEILF